MNILNSTPAQKTSHVALLLMAMLFSNTLFAQTKVLHVGTLLAVPGDKVKTEQTVVIADGVITQVVEGYQDPASFGEAAELIDLKNRFVLPVLMDMHVHLQGELGPKNDSENLKMSDQLVEMRSLMYAMRTLKAGFTTVRDVGSMSQEMYAMRDAINNGWVDGPRIVAAGGVGITGGHADVSGVKPDLMELYTSPAICDGPYDCRRATRNAIKMVLT